MAPERDSGGWTCHTTSRVISVVHPFASETHTLRWTLGDAFFGVGVYRLRFTVTDSAGITSRPVFRKSATGD